MIRKLFCSMVVMTVVIGFVAAAEYDGIITGVKGNNITVQKMTKAKKGVKSEKDGDPVVLTVTKDTSIVTGKFDKDTKKFVDGDPVKDGLQNEMFTKIDAEKGVRATITTDGDSKTATKIMVRAGKKKAAAE